MSVPAILMAQPQMQFAAQMSGSSFDEIGYSVAVDAAGNQYITGRFRGTADFDPGPGVYNMTANTGVNSDVFVVKLGPAQNLIWARQWGGTNEEFTYAIKLDASGYVYTYGHFASTVDFDPGPGIFNLSSTSSYDIFISKLDNAGNFVWVKQIAGSGQTMGMSMSMDQHGNLYAAGYIGGATDFDPGPGTLTLGSSSASWEIFVAKYDTAGSLQWARVMGGSGNDQCYSVGVDTNCNVYTTGWFSGTSDFDPGPGTYNLTSTASSDIYVNKLDPSGNFVWAKSMSGTGANFNTGSCVIADDSGNVYYTGAFSGTVDCDPGAGVFNLTSFSSPDHDMILGKFDPSGNFLWAFNIGGNYDELGYALALDTANHVFVSGTQHSDSVDYDPSFATHMEYSPNYIRSHYVAQYTNTGALVCVFILRHGTIGKTTMSQHLVVSGQKAYLTAAFENNVDFDPGPGVYNLNAGGNTYDAFVAAYDFTTCSSAMLATTSSTPLNCYNDSSGTASVSVLGGTSPYTYSWLPTGGNSATATGLAAGTYTCIITDNSGATITETFNITQPAALTTTSTQTNVLCSGLCTGTAQVNASGGTAGYTYNWSTSQNTNTISLLCAGGYSVLITDNNGCTIAASVNIAEPPAIVSTISATPTPCSSSTGVVTAAASGGTGTFAYSWQPGGDTTATINNLAPGAYTVTITDQNGCSVVMSDTVVAVGAPMTGATGVIDVACNSDSSGSATVTASGNGPFTFQWLPYGGNTANAAALIAGTYTIIVTDNQGCTQSQLVAISEPSAIVAGATATNDNCSTSNGSISLSPSGGTGPYTYAWSNSQTTSSLTGLTGGTYSVTITDNNGCTFDTAVSIVSSVAPTLSVASSADVMCYGDSAGSAGIAATGGTAPYTYTWQPSGGNSANANGLSAGTYTVTVSGSDGCSDTIMVHITQPLPLVVLCQSSDENCSSQDGAAFVQISGGTAGYTYQWSNSSTSDTITQLAAGTYTVLITDGNGCTETCSVIVNTTATVAADAGPDMIIEEGQTTLLSGSGGVTYSWQPASEVDCSTCAATTTTPLVTTTFVLTVADSAGCVDYDTVIVNVEISCDDIFVPNAFSPNGDGQNDVLFVRGTCIASFSFMMYNRWGELVFKTSDQTIGWDGTWRGQPCENAVFTYTLTGVLTDGNLFEKKGNVSLVK